MLRVFRVFRVLENSNIRSVNKSQGPSKTEARRRIKRSCLFTAQSNTKASPFPSLRAHSKHEGTNIQLCTGRGIKQNQTGELLWRDTGGIHWRILARRAAPARLAGYLAALGGIDWQATWQATGYSAGPTGSTGQLLWRDTGRDPLARRSGGILGGIHWQAPLAGHLILGGTHWRATLLWRDTGRDPLARRSGGILGGIHWRATLGHSAGYSAGSTG